MKAGQSSRSDYWPGVSFDISAVALSANGIDEFLWPLARCEVLAMRDQMMIDYVAAVRSGLQRNERGADALMLIAHFFLMEAMAVYQAAALIRRIGAQNLQGSSHNRWPLLEALARRETPPSPSFLLELPNGPLRRSRPLQRAVRLLRSFVPRRGDNPISVSDQAPDDGIVTVKMIGNIIRRHAALTTDRVTYVPLYAWFAPLRQEHAMARHRNPVATGLMDEVLGTIEAGFHAGREALGRVERSYLQDYLNTAAIWLSAHLEYLRNSRQALPNRLWTGTGGNIWARSLRYIVRETGGHVTGHDHAFGCGHFFSRTQCFLEFAACDRFLTYNEAQAAAARSQSDPRLMFDAKPTEIVSLPTAPGYAAPSSTALASVSRSPSPEAIRRIMYVSTLYDGDRMHLAPVLADLVAIDWQARLLSKLRSYGFKVQHKPHPKSRFAPPTIFQSQFGARRIDLRFEEVIDQADAFLFDVPSSTTFGAALRSGKPVILVDLGINQWTPEAFDLLRRRCAVVSARYDAQNRVQVDWTELHIALNTAPRLAHDRAFEDIYLANA